MFNFIVAQFWHATAVMLYARRQIIESCWSKARYLVCQCCPSVRLSICLSVCHTRALSPVGTTKHHKTRPTIWQTQARDNQFGRRDEPEAAPCFGDEHQIRGVMGAKNAWASISPPGRLISLRCSREGVGVITSHYSLPDTIV